MIFLYIGSIALFVVAGQILLKFAITEASMSVSENAGFVRQILFMLPNIKFLGAVISLGFSGFLWIYVIKNYELSLAYPLTSISYILMVIGSYIFLGEKITLNKIFGAIVIVIGIVLITWGGRYDAAQ